MLSVVPTCSINLLPLFQLRGFRYHVSSSSTSSSSDPHFMVEYLVNSCGFSASEAAEISEPLAHLKSTKNPDAVLKFMRSHGFDDANLRKLISSKPKLLCSKVEKTLAPKYLYLRDMGFSKSDVIDVVHHFRYSFIPKLKSWEILFGSRELLLKHMKKKASRFFFYSIKKAVLPNLKFLRDDCGIPEERISFVVKKYPHLIAQNPGSLRALVVRAEELGIPRQSPMFLGTLVFLYTVSEERFLAKVKLMRSLGWSESDWSAAVRRQPGFLCVGNESLRKKMEFLVKEVGCTPSYVAQRPTLLLYSLEKRLIPRFRVMELLKSKGFWTAKWTVYTLESMSDATFMEKVVISHREKVPELLDVMGVTGYEGR